MAELWEEKKFQKLVEVLRINQGNFANRMLAGRISRDNYESYRELQDTASSFSVVIKIVEDCFYRENPKLKRRKKDADK